MSDSKTAAKNIRKELKAAFPATKFRVRSKSNSVSVYWDDGATTKSVKEIADKYQYGTFNGMVDMYENNPDHDSSKGAAKYVLCQRYVDDHFAAQVESLVTEAFVEGTELYLIREKAARLISNTEILAGHSPVAVDLQEMTIKQAIKI